MIWALKAMRLLMVAWIAYGLVFLFAPSWLGRAPDPTSAMIQIAVAFGLGAILDRAVAWSQRRADAP